MFPWFNHSQKKDNDSRQRDKFDSIQRDTPRRASGMEESTDIVLTDEDGLDIVFEFLDLITLDGRDYVVLMEKDEDADAVVIMEVDDEGDGDEETYIAVDDDRILERVFALFKARNRDTFNFID